MNLKEKRIKCTDKELDFTFIEILDKDKISKFLEIDKYINSQNYVNQKIFSLNYPHGGKLDFSYGTYLKKQNNYFLYSIGTMKGSSGVPIMLINSSKIIGIHKGAFKQKKKNIGIPMDLIINKLKTLLQLNNNNKMYANIIHKNFRDIQKIKIYMFENFGKKKNLF